MRTIELGVTITDAAVDEKTATIFCTPVVRAPRCPDCGPQRRYRDTVLRPLTDLPVAGYPLVLRVRFTSVSSSFTDSRRRPELGIVTSLCEADRVRDGRRVHTTQTLLRTWAFSVDGSQPPPGIAHPRRTQRQTPMSDTTAAVD
jgi:hypothetical protein